MTCQNINKRVAECLRGDGEAVTFLRHSINQSLEYVYYYASKGKITKVLHCCWKTNSRKVRSNGQDTIEYFKVKQTNNVIFHFICVGTCILNKVLSSFLQRALHYMWVFLGFTMVCRRRAQDLNYDCRLHSRLQAWFSILWPT